MTIYSGSSAVRVTICCVLALVILAGVGSYGFSNQLFAHGPFPPPCDPGAMGTGSSLAHGPFPPPCDPGAMGTGSSLAHGPFPPPCDPGAMGTGSSRSMVGLQA
jgi:hypothetical protein